MFVYLGMFLLTIIFLFLSIKIKNKIISYIFLSLSIFLPCFLAALRGDSVGTDVLVYLKPNFQQVKNYSTILNMLSVVKEEYLYWIVTWICSNIFNNFSLF